VASKIENLSKLQIKAEISLKEINQTLQFTRTYISATYDDREAFDLLEKWADDKNFPFQKQALKASIEILDKYNPPMARGGFRIPWKPGVDPEKLTIGRVKVVYRKAPVVYRPALIEFVWKKKNYSKYDKMKFMIEIIGSDKSLKAVEYAGRYFAQGAKLELKPLAAKPMLKWWSENGARLKKESTTKSPGA
jgi:hypothetical protein